MPITSSSLCTVLSRSFCGLFLLVTLLTSISYAEQLPVKTYSTADGLVQDRVKRIVRDSRGFLWFCTAAGLSRFDGSGFTNYDEQHGLSYPSLNDLVETRKGTYWIASNGGGAYLFNPLKHPATPGSMQKVADQQLFTQYAVGNNQRTNRVNRLFEDHTGKLWAGTDEGLFTLVQDSQGYRFQNVSFDIPEFANLTVQIWCFLEDKEGTLWIGTTAGLVRQSPDGKFTRYNLLPDVTGNVLDLFLDREDRLWVSHFAGLLVTKPYPNLAKNSEPWRLLTRSPDHTRQQRMSLPESRGEAYAYSKSDGLAHQTITGTFQSSDGRVWISSHGGIMSVEQDRLRTYTIAQGIRTNVYTAMMEDRDGNLWFGSMTNGAHKLVRNGLHSYREADGLYFGYVLKIFEDRQGNLCVLDRSPSLIRCLAEQVFHPMGLNLVQNERVDDVLQDHLGEWWFGSTNGLYRFPNVTLKELPRARRQKFTMADGLGANSIRRLFEDSRGDLWISTSGTQPVTRWERSTGKFYKYGAAEGLPAGGVWSFAEDRAGGIWCGFRDSGLALYANGSFRVFTTADGLPSDQVPIVYVDRRGRLWGAVSARGAFRIDDPTNHSRLDLRRYTIADGLTSNLVSTFSEDNDGRIYLGTAISVDRIDLETGRVRQYTVADGLVSNESQSVYQDRHGGIWFGTTNGLSHLIPEADRSTVPPPVFIGGLSVAGVPHPISQLGEVNVVLPELTNNQNQVRVDFFGLDFAPGKVLRYQFKLEGADRDWSAILDQRSVNYANLRFGSYRFMVRAVNADGIASTEPAVVAFTIVPPLWLRWWFIVFVLLLLTITVHLIYRYHTRRLLELERVRTRIATDLHDDIGASLSKIAILSEVAAQDGGKPETDGPLTQIAETSRDMVDAMSDIVWAVNPQRDHLSDLTHRMRRFAEDLLDARDIEFTFRVPPHEKDVRLGADLRREVYLIFKECVNNLVKHSRCTRAELEFVIVGATLVINVNDNGTGFDVEGSRKNSGLGGHGLSSIERRATALGGSFVIKSESEKGTQISLKVPIVQGLRRRWWGRNYPNGR